MNFIMLIGVFATIIQMNATRFKERELLFIQRILAWQVARTLGAADEENLKQHALLIAVDYDDDAFCPLMIGRDFKSFMMGESPSWRNHYKMILRLAIGENGPIDDSFWSHEGALLKWKEGREFNTSDFVSSIDGMPKWTHGVQYLFQDEGHLCAVFWIVEVDKFRRNQDALTYLSEHDALTGLYNRHRYKKIKCDFGPNSYYIVVDLDDFKDVNDTYGHDNGDLVLVAVAEKLQQVFPDEKNQFIFRLGGDEFFIVDRTDDEESLIRGLEELSSPIPVRLSDGRMIKVRASIGYSRNPKSADEALYIVKQNGKAGFRKAD